MEMKIKSTFYRRFATLRRDQAGTLVIITALLFPVLLAFMGRSLDVGMIYDWKRREQRAADAAAMGAVTEIWRAGDSDAARLAGKNDSALNHFDEDSTNRDITVEINIPYNGSNIMAEAVITERNVPTYFMRVLGWEEVTVQSRAVAGLVKYSTGCILALNPVERASLVVQGTAVSRLRLRDHGQFEPHASHHGERRRMPPWVLHWNFRRLCQQRQRQLHRPAALYRRSHSV